MKLNRNKLYTLLFIACFAGYAWFILALMLNEVKSESLNVCVFKHATNLPCPSCGSTRSVISITQGNFSSALYTNPLGYLIAGLMFILPFWLLFDIIRKRKTLFQFYTKFEIFLRKPVYAIPAIVLIVLNWIWNIAKGI